MRYRNHLAALVSCGPLLVFAALLLIFYLRGSPSSHESGELLLLLNLAFTTLASVFIATLAGRSFLLSGRPALLAICVGMIIWGASAAISVIGEHVGNYNITIHNLGLAASGVCHLMGALIARKNDEESMRAASSWLAVGVAIALCTVGAIWMGTLEGWLPPFFIDGIGSTPVRSLVLSVSIALFAASAALTWSRYRVSGWRFLHWYSLGLASIALGAIGLMVQPTYGSWLGWIARVTQYFGGLYMLIGTVITVRESGRWQLSTEERLARSEQAMRDQAELLELAHDAIVVRSPEGRIQYWNKGAEEMYGWTANEAVGSISHDLMQTQYPKPLSEIEAELQRSGRWEGTLVHANKSGGRLVVASRWALRRGRSGSSAIVLEIDRDITEQQRSEEALKAADRRKDDFLAILAHELRNPLAPIRNAVTVLDSPAVDEQRRQWGTKVISRQVAHMALLLDDLLDVSRITRGQLQLRKSVVELGAVIDSAVEIATPLIEAQRHRLVVNAPTDIWLEVDPLRVAQVLANLLTNAAKFTAAGGVITVTAAAESDGVTLSVRDTGIGLDPESIPRLFTLFSQGGPAESSGQDGLGIGLALVKGLVTLHDGRVEARSEGRGRGSEFLIWLPRSAMASASSRRQEAAADAVILKRRTLGTVLIADDNRDGAEALAAVLELSGFHVISAFSGEEAWELAQRARPEALLLDIGMPGLSGYELAHRIRQTVWGHQAVLVAITGWGQTDDKQKARTAGFDAHFTKPADPAKLAATLSELLDSRESRRSIGSI